MKFLFVDFDGVLNSDYYLRTCNECGLIIDPSRMELLKQIIDKTGAKIVLSTSWREHWEKDCALCDEIGLQINGIFEKYCLEIYDKTPQINTDREEQILAFLDNNPYTHFAIIDDAFLSHPLLNDNFIRTANLRRGLDQNDVLNVINILSND